MQRVLFKSVAIVALALSGACADTGVGDPCVPETVPCEDPNDTATCGFTRLETYVESSSVQCRSRTCIVRKLQGASVERADPRDVCGEDEGIKWPTANGSTGPDGLNCVEPKDVNDAIYCTCRCGTDGPKGNFELCKCPGGFECQEVVTLGGDGIRGSYCVRPDK